MVEATGHNQVNVVLQHNAAAVVLPQGEVRVGRSATCFLRLDDPGVSRIHFRITVGCDAVLEDLGSRNGTLVNGKLLRGPHLLRDGDEIVVGSRVFQVALQDPNELAYENCCETPTPMPQPGPSAHGTIMGVSAVELGESCPICGQSVPMHSAICLDCGFQWPQAKRHANTEPEVPALSDLPPQDEPQQLEARYTSDRLALQATVHDLTADGAFVACTKLDAVGTRCSIRIPHRGGSLRLRGFVQQTIHRAAPGQPAGMRIAFTDLSDSAQRWIASRAQRLGA